MPTHPESQSNHQSHGGDSIQELLVIIEAAAAAGRSVSLIVLNEFATVTSRHYLVVHASLTAITIIAIRYQITPDEYQALQGQLSTQVRGSRKKTD